MIGPSDELGAQATSYSDDAAQKGIRRREVPRMRGDLRSFMETLDGQSTPLNLVGSSGCSRSRFTGSRFVRRPSGAPRTNLAVWAHVRQRNARWSVDCFRAGPELTRSQGACATTDSSLER